MKLFRKPLALVLVSGYLTGLVPGPNPGAVSTLHAAEKSSSNRSSKGIAATVDAAKAFLASLDEPTRAKGQFTFDDEVQRKRWSNLPTGIYDRKGIRLGDLTPAQRTAATAFLKTVLSKAGYDKVFGIMEGDETLKSTSNGKLVFSRDEYYIAFLGAPSTSTPWSIQFGGHHLALNITLQGDHGTLAPSHTAAQPAKFTLDGKTLRPLGNETDHSFALINALDENQRKQAIIGAKYRDLVLGPGHDGKTLAPEGVKVATFNPDQRAKLLALTEDWVGILPSYAADAKMAEIRAGLDETWFLWSGPTEPGNPAYFRIQGPAVFIEYAPQPLGGDPNQHIHTMFRDPTNEYGRKWLKP